VRVGAILGPEQRHELGLLAPHASWRILGLDAVGELRARAAAEVRFVRRQVEQRALTLAVRAAKERPAATEVARHAVDQDRRAAPFVAPPVRKLEALRVRLHAKLYRLGARLQEQPVPAEGVTARLKAAEPGKLKDIEAECLLGLAPPVV